MPDSESASAANGLGKTLERARVRAGLSRQQAAERLRLEPRVIEALETERFDLVGPAVYVRGHLRRYGELLGEDVAALEQIYARRAASAAAPDVSRIVSEPLPQAPRTPALGKWSVGAVAGLLVLVGVVWWALRTEPPTAEQQAVAVPSATAPASSGPTTESAPAPAPAPAPKQAVSDAAVRRPAASGATAETQPATSAPAAVAASSGRVRMTLSFLGDSWTEVYDASGRRLYYDTGRAGSVQTLQGQAPLRVVLGNAAGVVMDLNGRRVRLPADVPAGGNVNLSLDAAGQAERRGGDATSGVP